MELAPPLTSRIHLSQYLRHIDCKVLSLPSIPHHWRFVQRTSPTLGHSLENAFTGPKDTPHGRLNRRPHPSSLLHLPRRHPKCQQHHLLLHRRCCLRMDRRHAQPTSRVPRAYHTTSQQNRRPEPNMHVLPLIRPNILPRRHGRRYHLPLPPLRPRRRKSRRGHSIAV